MLRIARHTDYATRIVLHLSCLKEGDQASISEIAAQRRLPVPFVRRLIGKLVKGGILATVRGSGGGIRLGRPAAEISLLDLVVVMEGPIALNQCVDDDRACPFTSQCPVQPAWTQVSRALVAQLAAINFDALANGSQGHQAAHQRSAFRKV